jgi:2-polyprenyl-3-methyl-5-hydroxy-6-metoxy-1,4-benzoquinol methylase
MSDSSNAEVLQVLACPFDHSNFRIEDNSLVCRNKHRFAIENGIPVLTDHPRRELVPHNMEACRRKNEQSPIDPFVDDWLVNTNGNLYRNARGRLQRYPIPTWPSVSGQGKTLLDIGCGWGRWTMSAARAGFRAIGLDVHLDALAAAQRVADQIAAPSKYVCSDADQLPFLPGGIDVVYSYSVLQHLEKTKVMRSFKEISRVLKPGGFCLIQLPNTFGIFNLLRQVKRGFRQARPDSFEMRYWSRANVRQAIEEAALNGLNIRADGFFSQNPQLSDLDLLTIGGKLIVLTSHVGRRATAIAPFLTMIADSWFIEAHRATHGAN